ncbi:hypothetical protein HDU92_004719 [Lobulomyces angularis]|nr:hypothetical protein HDU92_004719 [Lobulomyces angularis]
MAFQYEKEKAIAVAIEAGDIIKQAFTSRQLSFAPINFKEDNEADLVTKTDQYVEAFVFTKLRESFPNHNFIGEESEAAKENKSKSVDAPTWVVDPIDGTTNFVHGLPFVCISLALMIDGEPVVGVVYNPILNELYYAVKNEGSYFNDVRLPLVNPVPNFPTTLASCLLATEYGSDRSTKVLKSKLDTISKVICSPTRGIRSLGSAALQCCFVAKGVFDAYWEAGVHIWDIAAGALIVREAGGVFVGFGNGENNENVVKEKVNYCSRRFLAVRPMKGDDFEKDKAVKLLRPLFEDVPLEMDGPFGF